MGEIDGNVAGYGSLSKLYEKEGYNNSAEISIYVKNGLEGLGIGTAMMNAIIGVAKEQGNITTIVSKITGGNAASEALHKKAGFVQVGTLCKVARKFGEFVDVDIYQLFL